MHLYLPADLKIQISFQERKKLFAKGAYKKSYCINYTPHTVLRVILNQNKVWFTIGNLVLYMAQQFTKEIAQRRFTEFTGKIQHFPNWQWRTKQTRL